ncbi:hypothetical protein DFS33DRAFT_1457385 [Desarmillaria ectypa]|nr:hypothetical protein DFS33DRAFT_1457385 [Desarmillaria ectypa]
MQACMVFCVVAAWLVCVVVTTLNFWWPPFWDNNPVAIVYLERHRLGTSPLSAIFYSYSLTEGINNSHYNCNVLETPIQFFEVLHFFARRLQFRSSFRTPLKAYLSEPGEWEIADHFQRRQVGFETFMLRLFDRSGTEGFIFHHCWQNGNGREKSSIEIPLRRTYTHRKQEVIPSSLADIPCANFGIWILSDLLNVTFGTSHILEAPSLSSVVEDCIKNSRRRACRYHTLDWMRGITWTPINGCEWPVPKDTDLDLTWIEMLNLRVEYAWLDVLCLRQNGGPREELRAEERKPDVPIIGAVRVEWAGLAFDFETGRLGQWPVLV